MPRKPRRPCGHPGCPRLAVEGGQYCEEHTKTERDRYNRYERAPDINKKYGRAWKRIRDRYAAAHPLCEMCLKEGRLMPFGLLLDLWECHKQYNGQAVPAHEHYIDDIIPDGI